MSCCMQLPAVWEVHWVTSVGGLNVSSVGAEPARHAWKRVPVAHDRHVMGMFAQVDCVQWCGS